MKKILLYLGVAIGFSGLVRAQTTTYLDFEGATPAHGVFGGSSFEIVDNPMPAGINTSEKVAKTMKEEVNETWGGVYFPLGGTINFTPDEQEFTVDVFSFVSGTATFKVEMGEQGAVEIPVEYTDPGNWQTLTFTFTDRNPDYKQIVIFMGFNSNDQDEWYYDNVKGPGFTAGGTVDVTYNFTDLAGTATTMELSLSDDPDNRIALTGENGQGSLWTTTLTGRNGGTILDPLDLSYTLYVNGSAVTDLTDVPLDYAAGSGTVTIARNVGSAPLGTNLLTDGGFDNDGPLAQRTASEWGMWSGNGGTATVTGGTVNVSPVQSGDNWNMQVEQWNFPLENGKTYKVTFDAWSDADRVIALTVEDPSNGYALLGASEDEGSYDGRSKWDINITTSRTTYERTMTIDGVQANTATKFAFLLAQTNDVVYIDDVSIVELESPTGILDNKLESVNVYPVPAEDVLNFSGNQSFKSVIVYDARGQRVKEFSNVNHSIGVRDLKSGIYMLRLTSSDGKQFTSKFVKK